MKTIWKLTYETIPGNGEQTKKYKSFDEAKKDIRTLISKIQIQPYTDAIREGIHTSFRTAIADFIDNYISRNDFLSAQDKIPSWDPDDYELEKPTFQKTNHEDFEDDDLYDEDEMVDEFEDFQIYIGKDSLSFKGYYEGFPELNTDMIVMDDENQDYYFQFFVETAPNNRLRELNIKLEPLQYWGTSSYPLLILRTLESARKTLDQKQIISRIEFDYGTKIERKAIGRNIALLKDLGYDIQHNEKGYYIPKKVPSLQQEDFQTISEIINASETLDDERKSELIDKLSELWG